MEKFNFCDNNHTRTISQLHNDIEEAYLKLIKDASKQMKLDFVIEDDNIYMPVYFKDDGCHYDYDYTILYVIRNDLTAIINEYCIYDRYSPENVEDCEYTKMFENSWSIDGENVPTVISNLKDLVRF